MSPTSPTFIALNQQLNKAHQRIRELEARETDLLARNRTLCAVIAEFTTSPQRPAQCR
jgi:cell division protein FtsB